MNPQKLSLQNHILEQLLEATQEGYWYIDNEAVTLDVNPAMCRILTRSREQVIGRSIFEFVDTINKDVFRHEIDARGRGKHGSYEVSLLRADGTSVPCINNATAVFDEDGQRLASIGLFTDISEIKKAEGALKDAHKELEHRVVERTRELDFQKRAIDEHAIISTTDNVGSITYVNDKFCDISGYTREELLGKNHRILKSGEHSPEFFADLWQTISGGNPWHGEVKNKNKNGHYYWTKATILPDINEKGKPSQYVSIRTDITEQKKSETEFARLDRILRAHIGCNEVILGATEEEKLIAGVCQVLVDTAGYKLAWVGYAEHDAEKSVRPVASYGADNGYVTSANVTYADTERGQGPVGSAIRTGKPVAVQDYMQNPKFAPWREAAIERGIAASIGVPLLDNDMAFGSLNLYAPEPNAFDEDEVKLLVRLAHIVSHGILSLRDTAGKKEAEDMLRKLSRALEQSPNMVFITDTDGSIEYINKRFTEVSGFTPDEILGKNPRILKSGNTPHEVHEALWSTILSGKDWRGELCDRRKDGTEFWARASVSPIRNGAGEITHFVALHEDITEEKARETLLREAKQQAEVANRAKTELMANMSHELRTPLNAIIGFTGAITAETFGPIGNEKYLEYIEDIGDSGQHLLELINDILDVSAIEAGKLELHDDDVVIDDLVESSIRLIADRANQKQIHLRTDVQRDLPILRADVRRMKQTLLNLLSNAVKFTPDDGMVTLSVSQEDVGGHVFTVTDTGIGMNHVELAKALVQFGQVDSGLSRKEEGTGLGLPLTKGLVELHGGIFDITSEKGVGTTVTVTFPPERVVSDA